MLQLTFSCPGILGCSINPAVVTDDEHMPPTAVVAVTSNSGRVHCCAVKHHLSVLGMSIIKRRVRHWWACLLILLLVLVGLRYYQGVSVTCGPVCH